MTLADHIEQDLTHRLVQGAVAADELRIEPLAAAYGTSTRPVREALARLQRRGLLEHGPGRTLRPAGSSSGVAGAVAPPPAGPTRDELMRRIVHDLVKQGLAGEQVFVREVAMAERLGVSATVIRELFQRLVGQGVLEHVPRRGWRIRPLRQKDLDDFVEAREVLERRALTLAWDRLEERVIRAMLAGNSVSRDARQPARVDNRLHRYFIDQADNRYIREFFDRHGPYFEVLFDWEVSDPKAARQTVRQHRRILRAILAGDHDAADRGLRDHLRYRHPVLVQLLESGRAREGS